ncbi:hypothetical protein UlMin_030079 [Ulmus minor]
MASTGILSANPQTTSYGLLTALGSAFLEWVLILLLFIAAIFSYIITKFARGCKLQTPCLLCSRLDHVLGKEKRGYCWGLMCRDHKSEVSSLVLCHAHNKLVDVHKMCESCLFSFATINRSNAETYRLLVGKLGEDFNSDIDEDSLLGDCDISLRIRHCSCCNQPWVPRGHAQELVQTKLVGREADVAEHDQKVVKKGNLRPSVSIRSTDSRNSGFDHLSHIGYTELKIHSDTESEALFSDDEEARALIHEASDFKDKLSHQCIEPRTITLDDDPALEKLINPESEPKTSPFVSQVQVDAIEPLVCKSAESTVFIGHGLEELNWQQVESKADIPLVAETTRPTTPPSSDAVAETTSPTAPPSTDAVAETTRLTAPPSSDAVAETTCLTAPPSSDAVAETTPPTSPPSSDAVAETTLPTSPPSSDATGIPIEVSKESFEVTPCEVEQRSVAECGQVNTRGAMPATTTKTCLEANADASDSGQQVSNLLDLMDAYKLAVGNRGNKLGQLAEQWLGKDSSRVSDDLKVLISQLSSTRGIEQSTNDISPKLSVKSDDLKNSDSSNSLGMQILQKRISLERNESGLSLDGSIVSEIEGESVADRLKRQVEHDKKLMTALYKELEEERNASAIATNQAMAMITRLQEEKAALHMEALQYLRMMEEQVEYDDDELQKSNELLSEKEKEIQDLEAEIEFLRKKYPKESMVENPSGKMIAMDRLNSSLLEFEDEKRYILQCLNKLDKTIFLLSHQEVNKYSSTGDYSKNGKDGASELEVLEGNLDFHEDKLQINGNEWDGSYSRQNSGNLCQVTDLTSLETMVSGLNMRLEALEADRNLLEHTINSLKNGDEGLQFVREIASHLRELRKITTRKDQTIS